jgi:polysaccharide pyruvyl transferase WcaK-like protein
MLDGLLRLLGRALHPFEATVVTADPADTAARHGVQVLRQRPPAASGFRNLALVRAALRADLVTLGGGDLIREQADGKAPALNWLARIRVPLHLRKPTAILGISSGELWSAHVEQAVSRSLRRVSLVAARDQVSVDRLEALSGRPVVRMGDLALEAIEVPSTPVPRSGVPRIGVAVRDIVGRGRSVPDQATATLRQSLADALDRVVSETGARVELIPFRVRRKSAKDDDRWAGESLAGAARTGAAWVRHDRPVDAAAFAELAAGLDLVVAVRLHGAVLGAAAGCPVLGIAYDPKVTGFLTEIGVPEQALALDASSVDIEQAIARSLADAALLRARLAVGVAASRERTRALEPVLANLAGTAP